VNLGPLARPATPAPPERFVAYTPCPRCGRVACHRIRAPHPAPTEAAVRAWEEIVERTEIAAFDMGTFRVIEHPPRPVDESPARCW